MCGWAFIFKVQLIISDANICSSFIVVRGLCLRFPLVSFLYCSPICEDDSLCSLHLITDLTLWDAPLCIFKITFGGC